MLNFIFLQAAPAAEGGQQGGQQGSEGGEGGQQGENQNGGQGKKSSRQKHIEDMIKLCNNNVGNKFSPTVIAAAITSQINKAKMPTHIEIGAADYGLSKDSVILLEQVRTIDKKRLKERIGHLNENLMNRVNEAIEISLGLEEE